MIANWLDAFRFNVQVRHSFDCDIEFDKTMRTIDRTIRVCNAFVMDNTERKIYLYDNIYFPSPKVRIYGTKIVLYNPDEHDFMNREIDSAFKTLLPIKQRLIQDYDLSNEDIICYCALTNISFQKAEIMQFTVNDLAFMNENQMWYLFG